MPGEVDSVLVVIAFESMFGNTRVVAEAVADGISGGPGAPRVILGEASTIDPEQAGRAKLLVVGGPTHYHGIASRSSIATGRQVLRRTVLTGRPGRVGPAGISWSQIGLPPPVPGGSVAESVYSVAAPPEGDDDLRAWLRCLPQPRGGQAAGAAFDTRVAVRWSGGAAYAIGRRLRRHGYHLVVPPQGFLLDGLLGPVSPGETEKARVWGGRLRRQLAR
jgi:hypothetical protein